MNTPGLAFLAKLRFSLSRRRWIEVFLVLLILVILNLIEPINQLVVRDVIEQHEIEQQLSYLANDIVIQALLCRRFEKDILLNLSDEALRNTYRAQWSQAIEGLDQAIVAFQATARTSNERATAEGWRRASSAYKTAMLQTLQAIDAGTITKPVEANQRLTPAKASIRSLTSSAMALAEAKDSAVEASSSAVRDTLAGSARILTLVVLAGCLGWVVMRR